MPSAPPAAPPPRLVLVAAAALLDTRGRVLLARRPPGKPLAGLWEFPGGKVEPSDASPEAALARELREELGVEVAAGDLFPLAFASHAYGGGASTASDGAESNADGGDGTSGGVPATKQAPFHLLMPLWGCRRWAGAPAALEGQELAWAAAVELDGFAMPPADAPLLPAVRAAMAAAAAAGGAEAAAAADQGR
jgi:8-oxo-dGTP diphosphatase